MNISIIGSIFVSLIIIGLIALGYFGKTDEAISIPFVYFGILIVFEAVLLILFNIKPAQPKAAAAGGTSSGSGSGTVMQTNRMNFILGNYLEQTTYYLDNYFHSNASTFKATLKNIYINGPETLPPKKYPVIEVTLPDSIKTGAFLVQAYYESDDAVWMDHIHPAPETNARKVDFINKDASKIAQLFKVTAPLKYPQINQNFSSTCIVIEPSNTDPVVIYIQFEDGKKASKGRQNCFKLHIQEIDYNSANMAGMTPA